MSRIVITLTTVPERLNNDSENGIKLVLKSLCEQSHKDYEVHFNLPEIYKVTGEKYVIPNWLRDYQNLYNHLKIFNVEDYGPPTKIIPTILRVNKETLIIVVDDDLIYHKDMVVEHEKYHQKFNNSVILYDGRSLVNPKFGDLRDSWVLSVAEPLEVKELQHYKSASYFAKYFDKDFFDLFVGKTKSDDILVSYYFKYKKIKLMVVPYEPDVDKLKNYNDWYKFQGVETFPVIKHAHSISDTGCNHPTMLKTEPKFYLPEDFKRIN